jgi:two-component system, NarL family, response regulator NreC
MAKKSSTRERIFLKNWGGRSENMINILLADDHEILKEGLNALIEATHSNFRIVDHITNGAEVTEKLESLKPDILIIDISLSCADGFEIVRQSRKVSPKTKVIVFSMGTDEQPVVMALQAGAKGYLTKKCSFKELVDAVLKVNSGYCYLSPELSERLVELCIHTQTNRIAAADPYDTLTPREREVLHLAAEGYTNADIANQLYLSRRTVETHRARIMRKLDLHGQTELVRYAIKRSIIICDVPGVPAIPIRQPAMALQPA